MYLFDVEDTLSAARAEEVLNDAGYVVSRKHLSALVRAGAVDNAEVFTGNNKFGDRVLIKKAGLNELAEYLTADSLVQRLESRAKEVIMSYTKIAITELGKRPEEAAAMIGIKAGIAASALVSEKVKGEDRLKELKRYRRMITKICAVYWLVHQLISEDYEGVSGLWDYLKGMILDEYAIGRFSSKLIGQIDDAGNCGKQQADEIVSIVEELPQVKNDLRAWVEIIMTLSIGNRMLGILATRYFKDRFKIAIEIDDTSPVALLQLLMALK